MRKLINPAVKSKIKATIVTAVVALLTVVVAPLQAANADGTEVVTVVDVNLTSASVNGTVITNPAVASKGDLVINGSPTGVGTANGISFPNTVSGATTNYLTGNLGSTTYTTKIELEIKALFPDDGCAKGFGGSMVFGLGDSSSYSAYNIYRHSGFLGFNTFNSEIYGIELPDTTSSHTYKFVMVPNSSEASQQEIWVDGVKQNLSYRTLPGSVCGGLLTSESTSSRVFSNPNYSNGAFTLMTHPVGPLNWGTTGTLERIKITTTNVYEVPSAATITSITSSNGNLSVAFSAPTFTGGTDITDYKYSTDGGTTWASSGSTSSPISISGLTGGQTYSVLLKAVNIAGESLPSEAFSATLEKTIDPPVEPTPEPTNPTEESANSTEESLAETGYAALSTGALSGVFLVTGFALILVSRNRVRASKK